MDSDSVQLLDYKRSDRRRRRRARGDRGQGDSLELVSDSELSKRARERERLEDTTVFSDTCDENLPSSRARLAASRRHQQSLGLSYKETTPLLDDKNGKEAEAQAETSMVVKMNEYEKAAPPPSKKRNSSKWLRLKQWWTISKITFLTVFVIGSVILFSINDEHEEDKYFVNVKSDAPRAVVFNDQKEEWKFFSIELYGPFIDYGFRPGNASIGNCSNYIFMCGGNGTIYSCEDFVTRTEEDLNCHSFLLGDHFNADHSHHDFSTTTTVTTIEDVDRHNYSLSFFTTNMSNVEFQITVVKEKLEDSSQVIISGIILVFVYVLIGFDVVHRTVAAIIGSTCTLGVLSMLDKRPTLLEVIEWIDLDTICLLFGMMTLVAIFAQTGFFDYSAVKAYKLARGKVWPLITLLCFFAAIVSAFLDNVTTILLLTPVSIRLCQVLNLDPRPILIAEVVFSNIGGTATAIGDPPNVIIVSNKLIKEVGIDFSEFTLHLVIGIIPCLAVAYGLLAIIHRCQYIRVRNTDAPHISELKREVNIWERTAQQMNVVSLEERAIRDALMAKAAEVRIQLAQEVDTTSQSALDMWQKNLTELESKYRITNRVLLIKSSVVLFVVIIMFFISNLLPNFELELGWIAIFGAVVLLLLADVQDMESILHKIEWGTLLFFAALFILMEGLGELGLIRFIGDRMVDVITVVPVEWQMLVSLVVIVWVSAIASSFIDNIPFTTAMIPVIVDLANSRSVCLQLRPLVWALALGACLGGNGTLIGASANVVCAGIAEQSGYKITFFGFFKIGFPMMIVTTFTACVYLMIVHAGFGWNTEKALECVAATNLG